MTEITILDGGMGQELLARTGDMPTPLWATQVMIDHPEVVRQVHADYFAAGADIATANSYAIQHDRLLRAGLDHLFEELHLTACRLACEARDAHGAGLVAGALGPLGWSYRPDLAPPAAEAAGLYAEIAVLQAPYVDLYICETMSSVDQARGAMTGAMVGGKPVWLALSVQDFDGTRLRSGELVTDILPLLDEMTPDAVLVNCAIPEAVSQALPLLAPHAKRLGAYANGFVRIETGFAKAGATVTELQARADLTPTVYADFAETWIEMGATIVGGCCEIGPAHIAELKRRFAS